ncbi:MGMT family protein [Pedobacter duraquae]|uniref:Methylated-DNA-protein-cysteine methyltransferase-like protein n=1 Tax=Pedobacter duraquae TaxID=425511 RepID=A0A4R6IBP7_9SPHI|nr:MGMT family protein [Pedobacter duraquae]TDO19362.1 methylated-DNA-protein-cysteine methyltransferase-like protein [Pedobacter duraquae]
MSDFYSQVYEIVRLIPPGRVTTYGAIAKALGSGKSSRLVGYAMNNSHVIKPHVPAHRVVNRNGLLTGKHHFTGGISMKDLLAAEGVVVDGDIIINFQMVFWDPMIEL